MEQIKVLSVFGTRPEAIKMAPLVKELERSEFFESLVCVTAQHREMLDQVLSAFCLKPQYDLDIMSRRQTLGEITTRVMEGMDRVIRDARPDLVLVHGDTTTTFSGALAAFYNQTPVGHVEAGLRTYDKYSPYPEEMNRRLTGQIADLHFAPTGKNRENLLRENAAGEIFVTGNTVIDALGTTVRKGYRFHSRPLGEVDFKGRKTILLTAHRRENLGQPLRNIMLAVRQLACAHPDVQVIYPVHLNPAVRSVVFEILDGVDRVLLIDPVDVEDMHNLMDRCYLVMTDSGGLQEEAPALGKPVLVLRTETERPEAVMAGTVRMAGVETERIVHLASVLLSDAREYDRMAKAVNPYGDGRASARIRDAIAFHFGLKGEAPADFGG